MQISTAKSTDPSILLIRDSVSTGVVWGCVAHCRQSAAPSYHMLVIASTAP